MKNVTITLPDDILARARVEAAKQAKSLSRYVSDAVAEKVGGTEDPMSILRPFFTGPGFPGISKNLPTREELYAEREEELVRRYESHRLHGGSERAGKAEDRDRLADQDGRDQEPGSEPAKPE
ncbi:hypothetical protein [Rhodoplanes elegans]|uniref:hypothetical protein n=1 Tax=Rhodoplanes elegans TaxID=29408 RepID=UPI001472836F|nr:hypothetical protein [Rhodoplanes elegans]